MQDDPNKYIAPIKGRVRKYLLDNGIKFSSFFSDTGVSESSFRGKSALSEFGGEILSTIIRTYSGISAHWLLTGEEESATRTEDAIIGGKANVMAKDGAKVTYSLTHADPCGFSFEESPGASSLLNALKEQLGEKDKQIAEKDKQIEMLHRMLEKCIE